MIFDNIDYAFRLSTIEVVVLINKYSLSLMSYKSLPKKIQSRLYTFPDKTTKSMRGDNEIYRKICENIYTISSLPKVFELNKLNG